MADRAIACCQFRCAELVKLLVATHNDVEGLAAQHDTVGKGIQFCRR